MPSKPLNESLHRAKASKQDEFYTQLSDIEKELRHYSAHFKGKTVLCNCDDPRVSNFFHYFAYNFEKLGLKKLITTCYQNNSADLFSQRDFEHGKLLVYEGDRDGDRKPGPDETAIRDLQGDGDFRSPECVALLQEADIVVTNPPFSLFREYVGQLVEHDKKFLIIGSQNAITYKEIFKYIKDNQIWLGNGFENGNAYFKTGSEKEYAGGVYDPDTGLVKFRNVTWFTNLEHQKRHEELILFNRYSPEIYPTYDNYDAIEVSRIKDIPVGYDGMMGVPITFLEHHNPDQFEIVGTTESNDPDNACRTRVYTSKECHDAYQQRFGKPGVYDLNASGVVNGIKVFKRILIRRKGK